MQVMALYYLDGSVFTENEITGYNYSPQTVDDNTTEITITYGAGGDAKSAILPITVLPKLEKIEITNPPTKVTYEYGKIGLIKAIENLQKGEANE